MFKNQIIYQYGFGGQWSDINQIWGSCWSSCSFNRPICRVTSRWQINWNKIPAGWRTNLKHFFFVLCPGLKRRGRSFPLCWKLYRITRALTSTWTTSTVCCSPEKTWSWFTSCATRKGRTACCVTPRRFLQKPVTQSKENRRPKGRRGAWCEYF